MNVITVLDNILSYQIVGISVFIYLGIFALLSILSTAYLALVRKPRASFMKWHHYMVGLSIFLALLHAFSGILVTRSIGNMNNSYHSINKLIQSPGIVAGQKIFNEICSGCHAKGYNMIISDLPIRGSHKLINFEIFLSFIRDPRMPDGSTGPMPSFPESNLSDADIKKLYNYLISEYGTNRSR